MTWSLGRAHSQTIRCRLPDFRSLVDILSEGLAELPEMLTSGYYLHKPRCCLHRRFVLSSRPHQSGRSDSGRNGPFRLERHPNHKEPFIRPRLPQLVLIESQGGESQGDVVFSEKNSLNRYEALKSAVGSTQSHRMKGRVMTSHSGIV